MAPLLLKESFAKHRAFNIPPLAEGRIQVGCGFRNKAKPVKARKRAPQPPLYPLLRKEGKNLNSTFVIYEKASLFKNQNPDSSLH